MRYGTGGTPVRVRQLFKVALCWALVLLPGMASADEREVFTRLEEAWNTAHLEGNTAALERLWSDQLTILVPRMDPMSKADALGFWQRVPVRFTAYTSELLGVTVLGTTAVVTGKVHRARNFGGRALEEDWYFTKVYTQDAGTWRVVAYHASEMPPPG